MILTRGNPIFGFLFARFWEVLPDTETPQGEWNEYANAVCWQRSHEDDLAQIFHLRTLGAM